MQVPPVPSNGVNSPVSLHAVPPQPALCDVCKIECNTQEVLNHHKQGKKHKKNLQKLQESITPKSQSAQITTANVAQRAHCEVCKIYCDTEAILNMHEQGKKHKKNLHKSKDAEPSNVVQSTYCATCNIICDTQEVLNIHNEGKKHKGNLWKLESCEQEKAVGFEGRKRREVTKEDLEIKKRKILDGGAVASEVKVCTICNVVVNSQIVYDEHIAGSKHAEMVKGQQDAASF